MGGQFENEGYHLLEATYWSDSSLPAPYLTFFVSLNLCSLHVFWIVAIFIQPCLSYNFVSYCILFPGIKAGYLSLLLHYSGLCSNQSSKSKNLYCRPTIAVMHWASVSSYLEVVIISFKIVSVVHEQVKFQRISLMMAIVVKGKRQFRTIGYKSCSEGHATVSRSCRRLK